MYGSYGLAVRWFAAVHIFSKMIYLNTVEIKTNY